MANTTRVFVGDEEFFSGIGAIPFEGRESDNPLAFKAYDADRIVAGKTMRDHLRFSVCYWHSFTGRGADPFGPGTREFPWDGSGDLEQDSRRRLDAAFEFCSKLGVPFYCFHDVDMVAEAANRAETSKRLEAMIPLARERQGASGLQLLWGTANLFSHPRYMNGAATNPDASVVAEAAAQVKAALDTTVALGGSNYVFWGGREGYSSLPTTDTRRELDHLARFLELARDYGRSIGFEGTFLIEPKPKEPMFHQYDYDAQTVIGFLRHHGLDGDFKLNIEANHATLAGHSFAHDLRMASDASLLGSIDANRGNPQNGWDTDQFPTDLYDCSQAMLVVLEQDGLGAGGLNFDAKLRRESTDLEDLFIAHIGGMDSFARGLLVAEALLNDARYRNLKSSRYESFDDGFGRAFERGQLDFVQLAEHRQDTLRLRSGKQELFENILNDLIVRSLG